MNEMEEVDPIIRTGRGFIKIGQAFNSGHYSIVKVLFDFQLYHPTKGSFVELQNEPIFSSFSDGAFSWGESSVQLRR